MIAINESDPFAIEARDIMSDPVVGSVVTTLAVSLSDCDLTLAEASVLCQVIEATLDTCDPWAGRVIACGLSYDKNSVIVVIFGAWIPVDFIPLMVKVQDALLRGERDGFVSILPPGRKVRKGSETRMCDLIRQARAKRGTQTLPELFS